MEKKLQKEERLPKVKSYWEDRLKEEGLSLGSVIGASVPLQKKKELINPSVQYPVDRHMKKTRTEKVTVLVENTLLSKETGYPEKMGFILYSAPTDERMAKALAESLKRCCKSYRIMTDDGKGVLIDQWLRNGFVPTEEFPLRNPSERKL